MTALESKGKPVQILRRNGDRSFELNESQLQEILLDKRVRDKPVVVVAVAGVFRQGKSFLLNFFLWYLRNNCRRHWLEDQKMRLGGFEWKHGSEAHTTGIWLWNQAFLVTTPQDEEVAVLLMDTQGSFDCRSSVKDCATIFALSVMTSSVLVYNVFRNIGENDLQHLQYFVEYGRMCLKESKEKPFQRLVFLVRDWPCPGQDDYGSVGGATFLEKRLQITEDQDGDLRKLREQILSCFSQTDCFLMPRPGDKVDTDQSFNGCLEDIDHKFKQKLQELLPWILAPENIVVKEINGQKITCQDFMNYFRACAEVFRGGSLPEPRSALQAMVEAGNAAAKNKAMHNYLENMKTLPRGDLQQMMDAYHSLRKKATEEFRSTPKFYDASVSQFYLGILEKEMDLHFNRLYTNEKQRQLEREREEKREKQRQQERKREEEREKQRQQERKKEEEKEKQRQQERKREEEREKQRQHERKIEEEREKQRQQERKREEEREKQRQQERKIEEERENKRQQERKIEEEREKQRQLEREREEEREKQRQEERKREEEREKQWEQERYTDRVLTTTNLVVSVLDSALNLGLNSMGAFRQIRNRGAQPRGVRRVSSNPTTNH